MFAPGPTSTRITGWWWSASTRPRFDFEHDLGNVRRAITDLEVDYPVAADNDYAIWSAFDN
jgi:hypothetical protein